MKSIYNYLDYRSFLRDFYQCRKSGPNALTHRKIAEEVGFDSGYFSRILKGTRRLSVELAEKFVPLLGLKHREAEYFRTLVRLERARTHDDKAAHFSRLKELRLPKVADLTPRQYQAFDEWYYVAVRELLACGDFGEEDIPRLGAMVRPAIGVREVKRALKSLIPAGLVEKDAKGYYRRIRRLWKTGPTDSVAMIRFHRDMLKQARDAFDYTTREERDMSTLTMSISAESREKIRDEISRFRKRLLSIAHDTPVPDRVYHMAINFFPMAEVPAGPHEEPQS
jgi:uncharacterized protein (TIGR02147 family)